MQCLQKLVRHRIYFQVRQPELLDGMGDYRPVELMQVPICGLHFAFERHFHRFYIATRCYSAVKEFCPASNNNHICGSFKNNFLLSF